MVGQLNIAQTSVFGRVSRAVIHYTIVWPEGKREATLALEGR